MLARLSNIPHVEDARADCAGSHMLLRVHEGKREEAIGAAMATLGGRFVCLLPCDEAAAQIQAARRGEPWFGAEDILHLSLLEARVLAHRLCSLAAPAAGLNALQTRHLTETCRRVLAMRFEEVHAEGGRPSPSWFFDEWHVLAARIVETCRAFLAPPAAAAVADQLDHAFPQAKRTSGGSRHPAR